MHKKYRFIYLFMKRDVHKITLVAFLGAALTLRVVSSAARVHVALNWSGTNLCNMQISEVLPGQKRYSPSASFPHSYFRAFESPKKLAISTLCSQRKWFPLLSQQI
jgi:hypothetical protein